MNFHKTERVAVFVDGTNFYATAKTLSFDIDYRRLIDVFAGRSRLVRAIYYTALAEEAEYSPLRPLIDWLDYNGYQVVTKPAKEFIDSTGRRRFKGSMDVEIAVDAISLADKVDHIVLCTGEGNFRYLVEAIQRKGCRVSVLSTLATRSSFVADELRRQADDFIDLADLAPEIGRKITNNSSNDVYEDENVNA